MSYCFLVNEVDGGNYTGDHTDRQTDRRVKVGFHYPSSRSEFTGRELG